MLLRHETLTGLTLAYSCVLAKNQSYACLRTRDCMCTTPKQSTSPPQTREVHLGSVFEPCNKSLLAAIRNNDDVRFGGKYRSSEL